MGIAHWWQQVRARLHLEERFRALRHHALRLSEDPHNPRLQLRYAEACEAAGQHDRAVAAFRDAAETFALAGHLLHAEVALKRALALAPHHPELLRRLGEVSVEPDPTALTEVEFRLDRLPGFRAQSQPQALAPAHGLEPVVADSPTLVSFPWPTWVASAEPGEDAALAATRIRVSTGAAAALTLLESDPLDEASPAEEDLARNAYPAS